MGSVGNLPATRYNDYGFEVENSNSPSIEFRDNVWKKMAELRKYNDAYADSYLSREVDDKISQLVDQYGDLESYDSDLTTLRDRLDDENITSDEYWAGYHVMADMLGISQKRYMVADAGGNPWDERYATTEQAEQWASEHNDTAYVYDVWTRKYRKLGGKNWRNL